MLPAQHRLTRGEDLRAVVRAGRRRGCAVLVAHLLLANPGNLDGSPPLVGFVVGRSVGNAVVRHRVQRRLRHLCRERLSLLPAGSRLVVRALPAAATATYQELGTHLDRCLQGVLSGPEARNGELT